jgi:hypothetical protein
VMDTHDAGDEMSEERLGSEVEAEAVVKVEPWSLVLLRRLY